MKKMLSLAAMFAVLSYASPASAEFKISGDASTRLRAEFVDGVDDNMYFSYRVRLKGAADLGSGYFFKTMLTTDNTAGGWTTVGNGNTEDTNIEFSNFYFGRMMENSHYAIGRLPMNSFNNPIFDLTRYPVSKEIDGSRVNTTDIPYATANMDRLFGMNYGTKIGDGELNSTLFVFGDRTGNDAIFNDSYGVHLSYKFNVGDVTVDPQAIIALTDGDGRVYHNVSSNTVGANVTVPAGEAKISLSGFYTWCQDDNGIPLNNETGAEENTVKVDYNGMLFRLKGEIGNAMAWVDYAHTNDKTNGYGGEYDNVFVWAQYKVGVYEAAAGTFSLTPRVRYLAVTTDPDDGSTVDMYEKFRTELVATVTF